MIRDWTKEQLEKIVAKCYTTSDCLRMMGYGTSGDNPRKLNKLIERYGIDTSHFQQRRGSKRKTNKEIFRYGSLVSQSTLRTRFHDVCDEYKCSICGLPPEWHGKQLTLMLDHVDGDHQNNVVENLRWVCPNCNSQLPTTGYHGIRKYDKFGNPVKGERVPIVDTHDKNNRQKIRCPQCGRLMSKQADLCQKCAGKAKRKRHEEGLPVTRDELKGLIRTKSFTEIGKQFHLSDNAIRKWCKKFNLPYSKAEIKSYTDSQWDRI